MDWGSEGYGHENGKESIHKWITKYRGVLASKEKSDKSKPIFYIEGVPGEYTNQQDLKQSIDIILNQAEV